jgi:hypothetical protein
MKSRDSESDTVHMNVIYRYNAEIRELLENGHLPFARLSDRIVLPDGSHVLIYERTRNVRDSRLGEPQVLFDNIPFMDGQPPKRTLTIAPGLTISPNPYS